MPSATPVRPFRSASRTTASPTTCSTPTGATSPPESPASLGHLSGASDFHRLGGDSPALITMVAEVARHAAGPDGEQAFVRRMPEIIRRATVEHVAELAVQAKNGAPA